MHKIRGFTRRKFNPFFVPSKILDFTGLFESHKKIKNQIKYFFRPVTSLKVTIVSNGIDLISQRSPLTYGRIL